EEISSSLQSLVQLTRPPGQGGEPGSKISTVIRAVARSSDLEDLIPWLQATMDVLQIATSSADFFERAAQTVVDLVGLDSGGVVLLRDGDWKTEALYTAPQLQSRPGWQPSRNVLAKVSQEKRTFWQTPGPQSLQGASLIGVEAVVAAPILDRGGQVIGAL